jgi:hypothetical protein
MPPVWAFTISRTTWIPNPDSPLTLCFCNHLTVLAAFGLLACLMALFALGLPTASAGGVAIGTLSCYNSIIIDLDDLQYIQILDYR